MRETSNLEIDITNVTVTHNDRRITSSTSRGNQSKWCKNNSWYKADLFGYEGLAEALSSELAHFTNISDYMRIIDYKLALIKDEIVYKGCYSKNFLADGWVFVPLHRLLRADNKDLYYELQSDALSIINTIESTVNWVVGLTGLIDFGVWLTILLEYDYLILNEDRHMSNIGVLFNSKMNLYDYAPLFDNGLSFCSDITDNYYPLHISLEQNINKVKAKPFSGSFIEQVSSCNTLYGKHLKVNLTDYDLNMEVLRGITIYNEEIKKRIMDILRIQLNKWHNKK